MLAPSGGPLALESEMLGIHSSMIMYKCLKTHHAIFPRAQLDFSALRLNDSEVASCVARRRAGICKYKILGTPCLSSSDHNFKEILCTAFRRKFATLEFRN